MKKSLNMTTFFLIFSVTIPLYSIPHIAQGGINIAGIQLTPKDLADLTYEATKKVRDLTESSRKQLERSITRYQEELQELGKRKDRGAIGQAEYELKIKTLEQNIQQAQQNLERHNNRNDAIEDNVNKVVMTGWQAFLEHQREETARKTQVAIAGVTKAVENEGAMERLQHMTDFFSDSEKLKTLGLFASLTSAGVIGGYYVLKYLYHYCKTLLGKPVLVAESSIKGLWSDCYDYLFDTTPTEEIFNDIVLPASVEDQLLQVAQATRQAHITGLPYRPVLLWGPPGTGKTMFAKKLAYFSDMDYAIIPGGNLAQFKNGQDIMELNRLFNWANHSKRGLILFFDEADAFLGKREGMTNAELERISTFLYHTGASSDKVLIVITTNRLKDLDPAVHSRMNKIIHMPLPNEQEREKLLNLYFTKYVTNDKRTIIKEGNHIESHIALEKTLDINQLLKTAATRLEGFSGRKIEQFIDELRAQCYYHNSLLTSSLFEKVLNEKIEEDALLAKTLLI